MKEWKETLTTILFCIFIGSLVVVPLAIKITSQTKEKLNHSNVCERKGGVELVIDDKPRCVKSIDIIEISPLEMKK